MTVAVEHSDVRHAWQRWAVAWHAVFAIVLLLGVAGAVGDAGSGAIGAVLALSAGLGLWYAQVNVVRPPRTGRGRAAAVAGGWALWLALIWLHVAFVPVGAFLVAHVCYLSLRLAVPVAAAFIGGVVLRGVVVDGAVDVSLALPLLIGAGVGVIVAAYVSAIARESAARADLITELTAARDEIARSERRRGVLEERQRLARDVHDTLAQAFTSVVVQLGAAQAATDDHARELHVERALAAAREGLTQARHVVWNLGDDDVDSLEDGVARVIAGLGRTGDLAVTSVVTGTAVPLAPPVRQELLHIAHEALTNADRHAGATNASVTISYVDDGICLDVCDDGRGLNGGADAHGYGLRSMRERADMLGGTLAIESEPGHGTTVAVAVPLR